MESVPVRGRSCLLRLRPFRKFCARTYAIVVTNMTEATEQRVDADVSAAASSPIGSSWSDVSTPTAKQPMNIVCSEPRPPLGRCQSVSSDQSEADAPMEEELPAAENHQSQQQDPEDRMELDDGVDPETGERAQG